MELYTQKVQQGQQHRSSFDSKIESPRAQNRKSIDAVSAAGTNNPLVHNGSADDPLRASFDARDLSSRTSLDIKDAVRASFQKERSRSSVDGRETRDSPRYVVGGSRYKDLPRSSVDGCGRVVGSDQPVRSSMDSPRLSMRIKEAVRAAMEGRLDSVRSSFHSKESLRSASSNSRSREASITPRSASTGDSRLLVELRESPRLSRDAPRHSCDDRDVLQSIPALEKKNNYSNSVSRECYRAGTQKARESTRHFEDNRGGPPPHLALRTSVDDRESPRLPREHLSSRESSTYQPQTLRSDSDGGRDRCLQQPNVEPRRRVPSLVARLMGLEDLPDDVKHNHTPPPSQQVAASLVMPHESATLGPQQTGMTTKKPSKESKLLKGLLQYSPRTEELRLGNYSVHNELQYTQDDLKHMFGPREPQVENLGEAIHEQHQFSFPWNGSQDTSPKHSKISVKQLGVETMPNAYNHQDARDIRALRQKLVQGIPTQFTEAMLTVLKNVDDTKRIPISYAEMEIRLRQLRLRSSLQEHKKLRQILEAMQAKGLLNGALCSKDGYTEEELGQEEVKVRQQQDSRVQLSPKQIIFHKPHDRNPEAPQVSKSRSVQELKKLGSRFHDQLLGSLTDDSGKSARPQPQVAVVRNPDDHQQSIVIMKPIVDPAKKHGRAQNPALLVESMPSARSPLKGRETVGRASPWSSPVNQPVRTQPGFGFGRESTGRCISEDGAAFKFRRERIIARSGPRNVHLERVTPRSSKLISFSESPAKPRSSSVSKEANECSRHIKPNPVAGSKVSEVGKRSLRSHASKEETSRTAPAASWQSQCSKDSMRLKKLHAAAAETEEVQLQPPKEQKSSRSSCEGKISSQNDSRDGSNRGRGPAEVIILRNRTSMGKRVTLTEPEMGTSTTTNTSSKKVVVHGGYKTGAFEKTKERVPPRSASTTPRGSGRNVAEHTRNREEQGGCISEIVRVTDGDALDHSSGLSPLVGLTNRFQSSEVGVIDLDWDIQGARTPRAGILAKKMFANQEGNLLAEMLDNSSEQPQPSPVSVLDAGSFHEEDVSPLALSKSLDEMQGHCKDKSVDGHHVVEHADTALQDWRQKAYLPDDWSPGDDCSQQLMFLRESAKILPPQGEVKSLELHNQAERVYVRDVLVVSGATTGIKAINPAGCMIDNTVFDYLEEKQGFAGFGLDQQAEAGDSEMCDREKDRQLRDRRMLFDCVNDALTKVLVPFVNCQPWMQGLQIESVCKRPTGQMLVQHLWDELKSFPPEKPCDDICDSLYIILQRDLVLPRNSWTEFTEEIEDIGLEIEKMIFKDLVEETLSDLAQNTWIQGLLA